MKNKNKRIIAASLMTGVLALSLSSYTCPLNTSKNVSSPLCDYIANIESPEELSGLLPISLAPNSYSKMASGATITSITPSWTIR